MDRFWHTAYRITERSDEPKGDSTFFPLVQPTFLINITLIGIHQIIALFHLLAIPVRGHWLFTRTPLSLLALKGFKTNLNLKGFWR